MQRVRRRAGRGGRSASPIASRLSTRSGKISAARRKNESARLVFPRASSRLAAFDKSNTQSSSLHALRDSSSIALVASWSLPSSIASVAKLARQAPPPDVLGELLVPRERVAAVDLHPTRDARQHVVTSSLLRCVTREVLHEQRSRAHQAHVAAQDVPKLR